MKNLVPIGRFSQVCRLTVKALRHYDELGVLVPAHIDEASGYRYYSLAQAADAERIRLLRSLGMPLDEVRGVLRAPSRQARAELLAAHRRRLQAEIATLGEALTRLELLLDGKEPVMSYTVNVKEVSSQPILGIRLHTSLAAIGNEAGGALGELFAYLAELGVRPAGPPGAQYYQGEAFQEDDLDVEFWVPIDKRLAGRGRMNGGELAAGAAATTLHAGPYDQLGNAYSALAAWIQQHGHDMAGPPRELYLVGPGQAATPADLRTEVVWPIR